MGSYNYKVVRKFFKTTGRKTYAKDTFCIPIHIDNNYWLAGIIERSQHRVTIIDSLSGPHDQNKMELIGSHLVGWHKDDLEASKLKIVDEGSDLYIIDPEERESLVDNIKAQIIAASNWKIEIAQHWTQDNENDCGIYTLLAMFMNFLGVSTVDLPNTKHGLASDLRSILLNFLRFKYATKSKEEFEPFIAIDLLN